MHVDVVIGHEENGGTALHIDASPYPGLCLRGGKIVLQQSRGAEPESLLHTIRYHNQIDNVWRKNLTFWYITKTKVELNRNFRRSLLT